MNFQTKETSTSLVFQQLFKERFSDPEMQNCIQNCLDCHQICEQLLPYCLVQGGEHAEPQHLLGLLACADICRTSAHFMMWKSPLHSETCRVCAQVCEECARDCRGFGDDALMKMCAEACERCAKSCHEMSSQH